MNRGIKNIKNLALLLGIMSYSAAYCQDNEAAFAPTRYEALLTNTINALQSRKNLLEEKFKIQQERQEIVRRRKIIVNPEREIQYSSIEEANRALSQAIEQDIRNIAKRIADLERQKSSSAQQKIKNAQEETVLMQKFRLQQTIADLEEQLERARSATRFIVGQERFSSLTEPVTTLARSWARQQEQLEIKLSRARSDLHNIR